MLKILNLFRLPLIKRVIHEFWKLHKLALLKNKKFENIHLNKKCLIFGNGGSLKLINFESIPQYIKIGCTYSLLDKRFNGKNSLDYCIFSYPYGLFPFVWSVMNKNFVFNLIGKIHKKIIKDNKDVIFFHSMTNYYSYISKPSNLNFFYNLNNKKEHSYDLSQDFNYNSSALEIMIGLAKYMGIKEVFLLGCDYLGEPIGYGHFYAKGKLNYDLQDEFHAGESQKKYINRIKNISAGLKVTIVLPDNINSKEFNTMSIEEFSTLPEKYHENTDILKEDYLPLLVEGQNKRVIYLQNDYKSMSGISIEEWLKRERKKENG